jgi:hypothetical protein
VPVRHAVNATIFLEPDEHAFAGDLAGRNPSGRPCPTEFRHLDLLWLLGVGSVESAEAD